MQKRSVIWCSAQLALASLILVIFSCVAMAQESSYKASFKDKEAVAVKVAAGAVENEFKTLGLSMSAAGK